MTTSINGDGGNGDRHAKLVEEIADAAAQKVLAKVAWFLVLNAGALIAGVVAVVSAYQSLDKRHMAFEATTNTRIDINSGRIERLMDEDRQIRAELRDNQKTIIEQNNALAGYLREHDRNTLRAR